MNATMKRFLGIAGLATLSIVSAQAGAACPASLDHAFPVLQDGKPMPLCQYAGKLILVVNTADYCGSTSQYDGREKPYARLKDKGLVVLGLPSNDFGEQKPGSDKEIADFCRLTYGVEFPMVGKTVVKGKNANPVYLKFGRDHRQQAEVEFPQVSDQPGRDAGGGLHQFNQAG